MVIIDSLRTNSVVFSSDDLINSLTCPSVRPAAVVWWRIFTVDSNFYLILENIDVHIEKERVPANADKVWKGLRGWMGCFTHTAEIQQLFHCCCTLLQFYDSNSSQYWTTASFTDVPNSTHTLVHCNHNFFYLDSTRGEGSEILDFSHTSFVNVPICLAVAEIFISPVWGMTASSVLRYLYILFLARQTTPSEHNRRGDI